MAKPKKQREHVSAGWSVVRIGLAVLCFILFCANIKDKPGLAYGYMAVCFVFAEWQGILAQQVINARKAAKKAAAAAPAAPVRQSAAQPTERTAYAFKAVGESHYKEHLKYVCRRSELADLSDDELRAEGLYDTRIYDYEFADYPVELVPEPENPHDPNAIRVMISGLQVAHIARDQTDAVRCLMSSGKVLGIRATVEHGDYRVLAGDTHRAKCYDYDFSVTVTITTAEDVPRPAAVEDAPPAGLKRPVRCKVCGNWIERTFRLCPYCLQHRRLLFCRLDAGASIGVILCLLVLIIAPAIAAAGK